MEIYIIGLLAMGVATFVSGLSTKNTSINILGASMMVVATSLLVINNIF